MSQSRPKITLKLTLKPKFKPKPKPKPKPRPKITIRPKSKPKPEFKLSKASFDFEWDISDDDFDEDEDEDEDEDILDEFLISNEDIEYLTTIPCDESGPPTAITITSFLPPPMELEAVSKISPTQQRALKYIVEKSKKLSENAEGQLLTTLKRSKYTQDDMIKLQLYIRDRAPIVIHIKPQHISLLVKKNETHYRNLFEVTPPSNHRSRFTWEQRMFGGIYDQSPPHERVKYGVLNIFNDPYGVQSCYGYGDCYLRLKKVRLRTTFSNCDTASSSAIVSCCEYYNHVLIQYTPAELKGVMNIALDKTKYYSQKRAMGPYREIQIHGDVNLREHVEALVINPKYKNDINIMQSFMDFGDLYQVPVVWMDEIM